MFNKYLKSLIYFLVPIILLFSSLEFLVRLIPNDYSHKKNLIIKSSDSISTIALGSSHCFYGFNPKYFSQSINLANDAQYIYYDYYILKKYIDYLPNIKNIVFSISYFSLSHKPDSFAEEDIRKYLYFNFQSINLPNVSKYELQSYSLVGNNSTRIWTTDRCLRYLYGDSIFLSCDDNGFRESNSSMDSSELVLESIILSKKHEDHSYDFSANIKYLTEIIDMCKHRQIKIFFVTFPVQKIYKEKLNKIKFDKVFDEITGLVNNNDNVYYMNYLDDSDFVINHFTDPDHLNSKGAEIVTKKIQSYITNSSYKPKFYISN